VRSPRERILRFDKIVPGVGRLAFLGLTRDLMAPTSFDYCCQHSWLHDARSFLLTCSPVAKHEDLEQQGWWCLRPASLAHSFKPQSKTRRSIIRGRGRYILKQHDRPINGPSTSSHSQHQSIFGLSLVLFSSFAS
jgi:hypothetical protein